MIELVSAEQLGKAIERARAGKLFVQATSVFREYRVTNRETGSQYYVNFFVRGGRRYGHCQCPAGRSHKACKHVAAAAGLHVALCSARVAGQREQ